MPLTRAQTENFVAEFFRDHRLPAPPVSTRKRFCVTLARRVRLNLPRTITRPALADAIAARLCREVIRRDHIRKREVNAAKHRPDHPAAIPRKKICPRYYSHFQEWRTYVRGVVLHHFGKGDGL